MKLSIDAKDAMKRIEMVFLNESRECTFQEDIPQLRFAGIQIGPFKKGNRANLPNWVIEKLLSYGYVNVVAKESSEKAYESLKSLQNLYYREEQEPHKLEKFPPYLYTALNRKALRLQSDKTSMDPIRYDEVKKLKTMIPFLVETRLSKIMRVAKSGAYHTKKGDMTNEERWLCEELLELLSGWRQNVME